MEGVALVPAVPEDAAETLLLEREVLAEGTFFLADAEELRENVAARANSLGRGTDVHLLARRGRTLLGQCVITRGGLRRLGHTGSLTLWVRKPARGAGIGRALLGEALRRAEVAGMTRVHLAVFADNAPAIRLYEAAGFVVEARRRGIAREPDGTLRDDLLMARWTGP